MKVTINGSDLQAESVSMVLKELEKEYNLKIRDLTMYIRFADETGAIVEPTLPGLGQRGLVMTIGEYQKNPIDLPEQDSTGEEPVYMNGQETVRFIQNECGITLSPRDITNLNAIGKLRHFTKADVQEALDNSQNTYGKFHYHTVEQTLVRIFNDRLLARIVLHEPIGMEEMVEEIRKVYHGPLTKNAYVTLENLASKQVDKGVFLYGLESCKKIDGEFRIAYLESIVKSVHKEMQRRESV